MPSRERLPEQDADRPHVALGCRLRAGQALGCDVRERSGHVADGGQRVRAVELGEPEVEQADRDLVAVLEQDVRRLDVAVDDPGSVRVRERVEHLGGDLDGVFVRELVRAHRLAHRSARDVLVGDVDVARVVPDVVRAHAALVAEPARRESLALGPRGGLSLARDDLERDVEAVALVAGEPDRARAAASERPHRAVAAEDELSGRMGRSRADDTGTRPLGRGAGSPSRASEPGSGPACTAVRSYRLV